ncbi:MAG: hypothetical protein R6V19_08680 [Armatimonadota bacterium]
MSRWGIVSVAALIGLLAVSTSAENTSDSAAAVVSMKGRYAHTVDITLPGGTTREQAESVWNRFREASGWRCAPASANRGDSVTIQARVVSSQPVDLNGMTPAWPFVQALSDYSTIAIVYLTGQGSPISGSGDFSNRYVTAQWTQSQGVRHYQIAVTDASFENLSQLRSPESQGDAETTPAGQSTIPWAITILLAIAIGVGTYAGIRLLMQKRK